MAEKDTNRGFGSMDEKKQRDIASAGGQAAHEKGTAHEFTSEEAQKAGRKGGESVSSDREHMSEIGRKGGEHSHGAHSPNEHRSQRSDSERGDTDRGKRDEKTRGASSQQPSEAGRQSHKNS